MAHGQEPNVWPRPARAAGTQFTCFTGTKVQILTQRPPPSCRSIIPPAMARPRSNICVFVLLYMCPHTAVYVSSYCYMCALILLYMCPHTAMYVSPYCCMCVLVLLFVYRYMCPYSRISALVLLYMCPQTAIYVSSSCYIYVLKLLYVCPHPAIYVPSNCYILKYMCGRGFSERLGLVYCMGQDTRTACTSQAARC